MKNGFIGVGIVMAFLTSGCGQSPSNDDSTQALLQRNNEKQIATMLPVAGTYQGAITMVDHQTPVSAKVNLYIENVYDGIDSTGAPKTHPELRAQLKLDQVGELDDHEFTAVFKPFDGSLSLLQVQGSGGGAAAGAASTNDNGSGGSSSGSSSGNPPSANVQSCPTGPHDSRLSLSGRIENDTMTGTVNGSNGVIGSLQMKRVSTESVQPVRDQADRLNKAYAKILGTYSGVATSGANPTGVQMVFKVEDQTVGEGITCPHLKAQFKYTDAVGKLNDTQFGVSYRESTGDIHLDGETSGSLRTCPVGPSDPMIRMDGTILGGKLNAELTGTGGDLGTLALSKVSPSTQIVDDQRDRLTRALTPASGTYGGMFTGPTDSFPVKIVVSLIEAPVNQFISCPGLHAQYIRPDLQDSIGELSLNVDFHPADATIVFTSVTNSTTGVPGHTDLTISGNWLNSGFSGSMQWWNRSGQVSTRRCRGDAVDHQGHCQ